MKAAYQYTAPEDTEVEISVVMPLKEWRALLAEARQSAAPTASRLDEFNRTVCRLLEQHEKAVGMKHVAGPYFCNPVTGPTDT